MAAQVIAQRYHLQDLLGRGGMGAVWRARDERLGRDVAIKEVTLPPGLDLEQRERLYARTFREARSAARLDHPGIVTVHDVVEEDGRPWIVMQLVPAPTLDHVLKTRGPLPPAQVAAIGLQLLAALRTAHDAGVIHRDVKPGNVLLPGHRAVLTDFGIATVAGDETLTQAGSIIGSPAYLAPEQARQHRASPASDLWSLGATLYAAVEGRPPYQRPDVWGVMAAVLSDEPDPVRLAGPLTPVLEGLLRKDPAQRLNADDTAGLLTQAANVAPAATTIHEPAWAPPEAPSSRNLTLPPIVPPTQETPAPSTQRSPRWALIVPAGVLAAALLAAVVVFAAFVSGGGDDDGGPGIAPTAGGTGPNTQSAKPSAGYEQYTGGGFTAQVPQGWKRTEEGRDVEFVDPVSANSRGMFVTRVANITANTGNALANAAEGFKKDYPSYKQLRFQENIPYQDGSAAELEFTFTKNGKDGRCQVRVFPFNGGLHMITMVARQDLWPASTPHFTTFLQSFRRA